MLSSVGNACCIPKFSITLFFNFLDVSFNIATNWTVQRQSNYGFSSVACDQTIEQMLNRDSKVKGGLVGITLNRGAMHRWILGQAERAAIMRQCESMANVSDIPR